MSDDKKESTGKRGIFGVLLRLGLVKEEDTMGNAMKSQNSTEQKDLPESVGGKRGGLRGLFRRISRSSVTEADKENQSARVNRQSLSVENTPSAELVNAAMTEKSRPEMPNRKPLSVRVPLSDQPVSASSSSTNDNLRVKPTQETEAEFFTEDTDTLDEGEVLNQTLQRISEEGGLSREDEPRAAKRKWVSPKLKQSEKELPPQEPAPQAPIRNKAEKSRLEAARERIRDNPKAFPKPEPLSAKLKASREELAKKVESQREQFEASRAQRESDRKAKLEMAKAAGVEKPQEKKEQPPKSRLEAAREHINKEKLKRPEPLADKLKSSREQLEATKAQRVVATQRVDEGNTALHNAVLKKDVVGVKKLLEGIKIPLATQLVKVNPDIQNSSGKTALHLAVEKNDLASVKALLEGGANVDIKDKNNENPIDMVLRLESEKPGFDGDLKSEILNELLKDRKVAEEQKSPPKRADVKEIPERFKNKTAEKKAEVQATDSKSRNSMNSRS